MNVRTSSNLLRIGVFYDGTYFSRVSNYYMYEHERRARLSIGGLHEFIREEVAREEGISTRMCQIVDAHYFRGRLSAKMAQAQEVLFRERQFDDVLIREGVTMHFLPLADNAGELSEKGIDVYLALEAYEMAIYKRFDIVVLITGDGDFVPLARKLNTLGARVMLLAWDFEYMRDGHHTSTKTSQSLMAEVNYPIRMAQTIDQRHKENDPGLDKLFVQRKEVSEDHKPAEPVAPVAQIEQAGYAEKAEPEVGEPAPIQRVVTSIPIAEVDSEDRSGSIITLHLDRGFGFVHPDEGGDNLFFHVKSLVECAPGDLAVGRQIVFRKVQTDRGVNAVHVRLKVPVEA